MSELYIGVMSGTSLDGIDVVLCRVDEKKCELVNAYEYPFPEALKAQVLSLISNDHSLEALSELDHVLGLQYAAVINSFMTGHEIDASTVKAIGLHGQTLWHAPNAKYPSTMQLGDPNIVTVKTGIPVVSDIRRKDVALGGQGAPLAPAFHRFMFQDTSEAVAVVNIGGMANITVLANTLTGYDTGPGNVLMDLWIDLHQKFTYDKHGEWAGSGKLDRELLEKMLADGYFHQPYPKSTGREKFNASWLESFGVEKLEPEDVQRTLLELTALSICREVDRFGRESVVLCGGGVKNTFLVERIKTLLPGVELRIAEHADMLEAMMMAWLAYMRVHKKEVHIKEVTGARGNTVLGALYE